jgi:phosphate transport system substrate-binding protein
MQRSRVHATSRYGTLVLLAVLAALWVVHPSAPADAAPAKINGSGSSYVALAMQQWVADAQSSGLSVNYLPTGSPDGLTTYANSLTDFAGTEAEFLALGGGTTDPGLGRGYQYVPDVAGAIAVMYNAEDQAGRKIDYLHLSRRTIARIFMGDIKRWSDPAITADNKGLVLPDQPITVVYRAGQSGTTALFYDFVQNQAPDIFTPWAAANHLSTTTRIVQLDGSPAFAPKTYALSGSDQIAQFVASNSGKWAIAYDEFGYALTFGAPAAWVQNQAGGYVQPYAQNISSALTGATLRADLSQELAGVYNNPAADAYPISAYSYVVTQCKATGDRPTCKGPYPNPGISETFTKWLRYIACEGQVNMARIGYSPLPPNLSQEIANSIARLEGTAPEGLNVGNCANPRFAGNLGVGSGSPPDPLANVGSLGGGGGGAADAAAAAAASTAGTGPQAAAANAGTGKAGGSTKAVGGGSKDWRNAAPVAYTRPGVGPTSTLPLLAFLAVLTVPPIVLGVRRLRRKDV